MQRVVIGISGGIDSAVSALLLKKQGYEVIGIHLNNLDTGFEKLTEIRNLAEFLEIPIKIPDVSHRFKETVIAAFVRDHLEGKTPSPCALCNPLFKWKILDEYASQYGAAYIATGHYIQKTQLDGIWYLKKGNDIRKDQSYYLWGLTQNILAKLIAPLGEKTKTETRGLAREFGLDFLVNRKESMGLCFSQGIEHTSLLKKLIPSIEDIGTGDVIDKENRVVGKHRGFIYYTIGQRKDLLLKEGYETYCVTGIDAQNNRIIAGKPDELWVKSFFIRDAVFNSQEIVENKLAVQVKIRGIGRNPEGNCRIHPLMDNYYLVEPENPVWAPASGQPAVFYSEDLLLGGGFIC